MELKAVTGEHAADGGGQGEGRDGPGGTRGVGRTSPRSQLFEETT